MENQVADNYIYDDNGNMKQDLMSDVGFIIYDINNQPLSIHKQSDGTCYNYTYDTQGNRIIKSASTLEYYINGADGRTEAVVKSNNTQATHNTTAGGGSTVSPYLACPPCSTFWRGIGFNRPDQKGTSDVEKVLLLQGSSRHD